MVGINVPISAPMAWHGFDGWKSSLFGDTHDGDLIRQPATRN